MTNKYANTNEIQYISKAVLALSLEKINDAYSGSCIKIRRLSDSVESDFGFSGSLLDWDAIITWLGGSTGYVVTWYDQSSFDHNAFQATLANQPELDTINKKILIRISNLSFLQVANSSLLNMNGSDWSLILQASLLGFTNHGSTINVPIIKNSGAFSANSYGFVLDDADKMYFKTGASNGTALNFVSLNSDKTWIGSKTGTDAVMYQNNVSIATGSSLTGTSDNANDLFIGKDGANINREIDMNLEGIFLYRNILLTETQRGLFND